MVKVIMITFFLNDIKIMFKSCLFCIVFQNYIKKYKDKFTMYINLLLYIDYQKLEDYKK